MEKHDIKYKYLITYIIIILLVDISQCSINLGGGKQTEQSSNYDNKWTSDKAVDGCKSTTVESNCCTHTGLEQNEVWWQVDLQEQVIIDSVHIYYRDNYGPRFAGYSVFLSNTSNGWQDGMPCYKDMSPDIASLSLTPELKCFGITQYLTIYNDRRSLTYPWYSPQAVLSLCEVEVYGCRKGKYGDGDCLSNCSTDCINSLCHPISGKCLDCANGKFKAGIKCVPCPENCINDLCDVNSGSCSECKPGFYGTNCNKHCPVNCIGTCSQYNGFCTDISQCSINLSRGKPTEQSSDFNSYTEWISGKAVDGCNTQTVESGCCTHTKEGPKEVWWQVNLQEQVIIDSVHIYYRNNYGPRFAGYNVFLSNTSNGWQDGMPCYKDMSPDLSSLSLTPKLNCFGITQYLTIYNNRSSLTYSWYSSEAILELCEVEVYGCRKDKYGENNCDSSCSTDCIDSLCHPNSGKCLDCASGKYKSGTSCVPCPQNCFNDICDVNSGSCSECKPGFYGTYCKIHCPVNCIGTCSQYNGSCTECNPGYFGDRCETTCVHTCKDNVCIKENGFCSDCEIGFHGQNCAPCSVNCRGSCNKTSGICYECKPGYFGDRCDANCSHSCRNNICIKDSGLCSECQAGFYGDVCNQTCPENCAGNICARNTGLCEERLSASTSQVGLYAGVGITVAVLVVLITVAVVLVLRRKRMLAQSEYRSGTCTYRQDCLNNPTDLTKHHQEKPQDTTDNTQTDLSDTTHQENVYENAGMLVEGKDDNYVSMDELKSMIQRNRQNGEYNKEFKIFPWGAIHSHAEGMRDVNKAKNRFKTTFPNDHSRVILNTDGNDANSNYINANFIDSVDTCRMYIASQGPKPNTQDDFWRMVWQCNTGIIVMVTNLVETAIVKCHKYWPDEGMTLDTKHFKLTLDQERKYAFYVIRNITITNKKTSEKRQVHHFHFIGWPDHGTPDTLQLALFHRRVSLYEAEWFGQIVVHCSAGLGRTGTFIALDALLRQVQKTGRVDIPGYIRIMRKDRMNMVQTCDQYICIHEALIEAVNMPDTLIPREQFGSVLKMISSDETPMNHRQIAKEFDVLQSLKPSYDAESYTAALKAENKVDKFRVYLNSEIPGRTDYINAIVMQSYLSKQGYLVTQFPLADTVDDLLAIIIDYSCETIVVLGNPGDHWLREKDETNQISQYYVIKENESELIPGVKTEEYIVTNKNSNDEISIRVYTMKEWTSELPVPPDTSSLLGLLELLDSRCRSDDTKPVVVMCLNGCTQSGLFCCISNAREQIKIDQEVDIFQTARQLQIVRPDMIGNIDQYEFCYKAIKQYLESDKVYVK